MFQKEILGYSLTCAIFYKSGIEHNVWLDRNYLTYYHDIVSTETLNTYYAMRTCILHAEHFLLLTRARVYQNHIETDLILLCNSPRGGAIPCRLFLRNYRTDHPEILFPYNSELTMVVCNFQYRYVRSPLDISHISPEGVLQRISQNVCHQSLLKLCRILVWTPWSDIWEGLYVNVQKVSEY